MTTLHSFMRLVRTYVALLLYTLALLCLVTLGLLWISATEAVVRNSSTGDPTGASLSQWFALAWILPLGIGAALAAALLRLPPDDFADRATKLSVDQRVLQRLLVAGHSTRLAVAACLLVAAVLWLAMAGSRSFRAWGLAAKSPGAPGELLSVLLQDAVLFAPIIFFIAIAIAAILKLAKGTRAAPSAGQGR